MHLLNQYLCRWLFVSCLSFVVINKSTSQEKKTLQAHKIKSSIIVDGLLNESVWNDASVASNFIQRTPTFGILEQQPSVVKILYDDEAIYIGAFFNDSLPQNIPTQITERDNESNQNADVFYIAFDTYNDKQNAFVFAVTSAGVQSDYKYGENISIQQSDGSYSKQDKSWDAIWENVSRKNDKGWVAELKIPFAILRFPKKNIQAWGMQLVRYNQSTREAFWWNETNPQTSNLVSQYGVLEGLENINPPLRLFLYPNASAGISRQANEKNKMSVGSNYNVGLDVKYGINESFTLDMTLVPDFGQVVSDNKILNVSPFEQRFDERRPFFTEGADLFSKSNIFYSRRIGKIGSTPELYNSIESDSLRNNERLLSHPTNIQLINASKISGRNSRGTAIAVLNAITKSLESTVEDSISKQQRSITSEPLSNYTIGIIDQSIKNGGSITFANANVWRQGNFRKSNVSSLNATLYDKQQKYSAWFSHQLSIVNHPYNNPNNYLVNANINSQFGIAHYMGVSKISGAWQWELYGGFMNKNFDPNDMGFGTINNIFESGLFVKKSINVPNKYFLKQIYSFGANSFNILAPFAYSNAETFANVELQLLNFHTYKFTLFSKPFWGTDFFEARQEGRIFKKVPFIYGSIDVSTDTRKVFSMTAKVAFAESELPNDPYYTIEFKPTWRVSSKLNISWILFLEDNQGGYGFANKTSADSIFISARVIQTISNVLKINYFFTQFMNLNLQIRHYWSSVQYPKIFFLKQSGYWENTEYKPSAALEKNYNTFTLDFNYSWQFMRGSFINLTWKNFVNTNQTDNLDLNSYSNNLLNIISYQKHTNQILLKLIYFLDIHKLQKH